MNAQFKKRLSLILTVFMTLYSFSYVFLSIITNDVPTTYAYSYSSGSIDLVHGTRTTPEEPSGDTGDVTIHGLNNYYVAPACGGGYNGSDNNVKRISDSSDTMYFYLNLPTGTYNVDITARYGAKNADCTQSISESDETLRISIDNETQTVSDQGNDFFFLNYANVATGFTVDNPNLDPVMIEVEGTGNPIDFGAIRIHGDAYEVTNELPTVTSFNADCDQIRILVNDPDITNVGDYEVDVYLDSDATTATRFGRYNTNNITINNSNPLFPDDTAMHTIIIYIRDLNSEGDPAGTGTDSWVGPFNHPWDRSGCAGPSNPPTCTLSVSPKQGEAPLNARLDYSFSDPDNDLFSASLSYGDNSSPETLPLSPNSNYRMHTYQNTGSFHPVLTVRDQAGHTTTCEDGTVVVGTPTTNNPIILQRFEADCDHIYIQLLDSDLTNPGDYLVDVYLDQENDAHKFGRYNSNSITIDSSNPLFPDDRQIHQIIIWAIDYDSLGNPIDNGIGGWVHLGTRQWDRTSCGSANLPPECSLTAHPNPATAGQTIYFDYSFSDPDGSIVEALLNYDDNSATTSLPVIPGSGTREHIYQEAGRYDPVLTVTDDDGVSVSCEEDIIVEEPGSAFPTSSIYADCDRIVIDINDPDISSPSGYTVDVYLDDDTSMSHRFGRYNTNHIVIDSSNPLFPDDTDIHHIFVWVIDIDENGNPINNGNDGWVRVADYLWDRSNCGDGGNPPVCTLSANPLNPYVNQQVTFNTTHSDPDGTVVSAVLGFGDGANVNVPTSPYSTMHSYSNSGNYTAIFTVRDNENLVTECRVNLNIRPTQTDESLIAITKEVTPASPTPANTPGAATATASYSVRVTNTAISGNGQTATNVRFTDTFLPPSGGGSVTGYSNVTGATLTGNTFTIPTIAPNQTVTVTYTVTFSTNGILPVAQGNLPNYSDITNRVNLTDGGSVQIDPAHRTDDATVRLLGGFLSQSYNINVKKYVNGEDANTPSTAITVQNGSTLNYRITVSAESSNSGPVTVTLTDDIDTLSYVDNIRDIQLIIGSGSPQSIANINAIPNFSLNPGEGAELTYHATAAYTFSGTSPIQVNTATADTSFTNPVTDRASIYINGQHYGLSIHKYVNGEDANDPGSALIVDTGSDLHYRIVVQATGTNTGPLSVDLTDDVDSLSYLMNIRNITLTSNGSQQTVGNINNIPVFTLNPGDGAELVYTATAEYTVAGQSPIQTNRAEADTSQTLPVNDVASVYINGPSGNNNVEIDKYINGEDADNAADAVLVADGDTVNYHVRVQALTSNNSNVQVTLTDNAYTLSNLDNTRTIVLTINGGSPQSIGNLNSIPNFTLQPGSYADLTYLATAENTTSADVMVVNTATAQSPSFPTVYDQAYLGIEPNTIEPTTYLTVRDLIGTVSGTYHDADTLSDAVDFGQVNTTTTAYYRVVVENTGNSEARNVRVRSQFVNGTYGTSRSDIQNVIGATYNSSLEVFTIDAVQAGSSSEFTFQATIHAPNASPVGTEGYIDTTYDRDEIISFDTDASASNRSGVGENDRAYLELQGPGSQNPADFTIDKSVSDDDLEDGDDTTYTIRITNTGQMEGEISVDDTIGDYDRGYLIGDEGGRLEYNDDLAVTNAVSHSGDIDDDDGVTLRIAGGETAVLTYTVTASMEDMNEEKETNFDNSARLSNGQEDTATVLLTAETEFEISKRVSAGTVHDGDIITYTITVENNTEIRDDVDLTDTIGSGSRGYLSGDYDVRLVYVPNSLDVRGMSSSDVRGDIDDSDGLTLRDFPGDEEVEITYQVRVEASELPNDVTITIGNEAEIEWDDGDDSDRTSVTIVGDREVTGDFSVRKTANPTTVSAGGVVTFQIAITNTGDETNTVTVTDSISQSGFLVGDNGGTLRYMTGSQRITGHASYSGDIGTFGGVTLYDVSSGRTVFITYQVIADNENMGSNTSSSVRNNALLSTGEEGYTSVTITQTPPPQSTYRPPVVYVRPPVMLSREGGSQNIPLTSAMVSFIGAGLASLYFRKEKLLGMFKGMAQD